MTITLHAAHEAAFWFNSDNPQDGCLNSWNMNFILVNRKQISLEADRRVSRGGDYVLQILSLGNLPSEYRLSNIELSSHLSYMFDFSSCPTIGGCRISLNHCYKHVTALLNPEQKSHFDTTMVKVDELVMPFLRKETKMVTVKDFLDVQISLGKIDSDLKTTDSRLTLSLNCSDRTSIDCSITKTYFKFLIDKVEYIKKLTEIYQNRIFLPLDMYPNLHENILSFPIDLISLVKQYAMPYNARIGTEEALQKTKEEDQADGVRTVMYYKSNSISKK